MREGTAGSGGREGSCHETIAEGCGKERGKGGRRPGQKQR